MSGKDKKSGVPEENTENQLLAEPLHEGNRFSDSRVSHRMFGRANRDFVKLRDKYLAFANAVVSRNQQIALKGDELSFQNQLAESEAVVRNRMRQVHRADHPERMLMDTGQPVPFSLKNRHERQLGMDLSAVRLHTDPKSAQFVRQLQAHAVTIQHHIFAAPEELNLEKASGRALLTHELTHVQQQEQIPQEEIANPARWRHLEVEALAAERVHLSAETGFAGPAPGPAGNFPTVARQHFRPQGIMPGAIPVAPAVLPAAAVPMTAAAGRVLPDEPVLEQQSGNMNRIDITQKVFDELKLKLQTEKERSGVRHAP